MSNIIDQAQKIIEANGFADSMLSFPNDDCTLLTRFIDLSTSFFD